MSRRRKLSAEERALWDSIARQAVPLNPKKPGIPEPEAAGTPPKNAELPPPQLPIPEFRIGERSGGRKDAGPRPTAPAPRMDARSYGRMQRGKLTPEARIDLHGMTVAEAHPALLGFILRSHAEGRRLVLVITGKGRANREGPPYPVQRGVLRQQVPQWLRLPPVAGMVLEVTPAHIRHGGDGAFYVYLSRRR